MKQREDTIRKWFSLWLDSREAELSDLFTEDAAYIESWGPEYYGREMIARWFRDWHRSGQVLRWDIQEFLNSENTTVVRWYFQCQISGAARRTAFIGAWGCASTSRKTIRSVEAEWMVFRICITGALLASIIPNWV